MFTIYHGYWHYKIWVALVALIKVFKMTARNFRIKISIKTLFYLGFCVARNHSLAKY